MHHIRPEIKLIVAMFDATARQQLELRVPLCQAISPASIAVPSMVAAALGSQAVAIRRARSSQENAWVQVRLDESPRIAPYETPFKLRRRGILGRLRGQLFPYDVGAAVLLTGAIGLIVMILIDTAIGLRHDELPRALYDAVRTTATISAPELGDSTAALVWSSIAALLVLTFTALFAAGVVNYVLSGRRISILGRRVLPRSGHVIVVGAGQVGLRFMQELRALRIASLGIEKSEHAQTLAFAKQCQLPILIGDGSSRSLLSAAAVKHCISVVAAASEERDNIAVAVSALAVNPLTNVVLRAGSDDAIAESQSLFHIGPVIDVNGLTAVYVTRTFVDAAPYLVVPVNDSFLALNSEGETLATYPHTTVRCACD